MTYNFLSHHRVAKTMCEKIQLEITRSNTVSSHFHRSHCAHTCDLQNAHFYFCFGVLVNATPFGEDLRIVL